MSTPRKRAITLWVAVTVYVFLVIVVSFAVDCFFLNYNGNFAAWLIMQLPPDRHEEARSFLM